MTEDDSDPPDAFDALLREAAAVPTRPVRAPGTVIAGRYRLDRLIGEGGMGIVWAATHAVTRQRVALKLMRGPDASRAEARKRFLREARAAAAVDHPSVVPIRDVFTLDDGELVMVMDLLVGETLRAKLERDGPLSLAETADVMLPVVSAVGAAHAQGIVHRDLKPENLLLTRDPPDTKVLDFGLAKLLPELTGSSITQLTETGELLGTPHYMAPEQALGEATVDQRADVWSLGAIVFECLTGQRFVDEHGFGRIVHRLGTPQPSPSSRAPELPEAALGLLDRILQIDRDARPDDLRPLYELLARQATRPAPSFGPAAVVASEPPPSPPPPRSRLAVWIGGLAALVVTAAWALGTGDRTVEEASLAERGAGGAPSSPASTSGRASTGAKPATPGGGGSAAVEQEAATTDAAPFSPRRETPPSSQRAARETLRAAPAVAPSRPEAKPGLIEEAPF